MTVYLLQCPKCKNKMKYESRALFLSTNRKRCVYCGMSFVAKGQIVRAA